MHDKLTDSEIVKVKDLLYRANCVGRECDGCPNFETVECINNAHTHLLRRYVCELQTENDRLQAELDEYKKIKTTIDEFWEILLTLSLFKRKEKPTLEEFAEAIQEIKAEAYKECIEKAKNKILPMLTTATLEEKETICFCLDKLDNLLKELVGEDK